MKFQIPDNLTKMIGLKCCAAKLVLDKGLRIEFGKQVFHYHSKRRGKDVFRGKWDLISKWSSWRVVQDNRIACSACDSWTQIVKYTMCPGKNISPSPPVAHQQKHTAPYPTISTNGWGDFLRCSLSKILRAAHWDRRMR